MDQPSRRAVLAGMVGASAVAVSGCSASSGSPTTSIDARPGDPLVAAGDVAVGGGVVLAEQAVVVTQPQQGSFRGFSAVCTHAGCLVAEVVDGQIVCSCHGSRFSAADGSVVQGPAAAPLPEVAVTVTDGEVVRA